MPARNSRTVVKRTRDEALEHVKTALRTKSCLLTRQELSFIRTSCQILGTDYQPMTDIILEEAESMKVKGPRRVMELLQARLKELATRVDRHKRPTPNPAGCTRAGKPMGAAARSLANLTGCADALKQAIESQYSMGIGASMKALENAKLDFANTIDRLAEANRWGAGTKEDWTQRGELASGSLLEEAASALKEAEKREEAEAKVRLMEAQCEELANLTAQAGRQVPAEAEAEVLEELEEDMDHREELVETLGQTLMDAVPENLKARVEEAMKESVAVAAQGRRYVDHVRARLDFSKDSESSGSRVAVGAAQGGWQTAAEELGEEVGEEPPVNVEERGRPTGNLGAGNAREREATGGGEAAPRYLMEFMRSFGQMRANDEGWPTFDGRYVGYPRFKKEWAAYRSAYHSAVSDDLAARTLRSKCLKGEASQMVSHLDDLQEIWETLDTCYERPSKYAEEALRPIIEFRKYRAFDSVAVREFYSLVRAAIRGARKIGRTELLLNDQTIPQIMSKMPPFDWREWATKSANWMGQDANLAFEDFIERKWQDAINIAATEPAAWKGEPEKTTGRAHAPDRVQGGDKGAMRLTGAVNTVEQQEGARPPSPHWGFSFRKKCRARNLIGCDGNHVILKCEKLHSMKLAERKEVVEKSGLCTFCLRHGADVECYAKGGLSKPKCERLGCNGEHVTGLHALLGEADVAVNLVGGEEGGAAGAHGNGDGCPDGGAEEHPWDDYLDAEGEMEEAERWICSHAEQSATTGTYGAEAGEWEYESMWVGTVNAVDAPDRAEDESATTRDLGPNIGSDQGEAAEEAAEDRGEQRGQGTGPTGRAASAPREAGQGSVHHPSGDRAQGSHPRRRLLGRLEYRTEPGRTEDQQWEKARHDAWLRQLLSDDSSDEDEEERYGRFAESGRWMSELYGIPQYTTTTLGRECSAQ